MRSKNSMSILERSAAVILVANRDFGRCVVASKLPRALWPVGEKTVLQRLVDHIASEGINKIVICSVLESVELGKSLDVPEGVELRFHKELFPRGTAGSMFDAWHIAAAELLFVFHAEIVSPPNIETILSEHIQSKCDMTIVFNQAEKKDVPLSETAQIYVCEQTIMQDIPQEGYCDIKETLIPKLVQNSKTIYAAQMSDSVGDFRNWQQYLAGIARYMKFNDLKTIASSAQIESDVKIIPPVLVCENATIASGAVILGPAIIGKNVSIGANSVISESVLWDGTRIGKNCLVQKSLLKHNSYVCSSNTVSQALLTGQVAFVYRLTNRLKYAAVNLIINLELPLKNLKNKIDSYGNYAYEKKQHYAPYIRRFIWILIFVAFIWSYWTSVFTDLWEIWMQSDEYSSGFLVPLITAYIIWSRREEIAKCKITPSLWGLVLFVLAQAFRYFGLFFMYDSAERISMLITVSALVLLLFGWKILARLTTVLLFLSLMIPLPSSVHYHLTIPLQNWATTSAVYCLETFGFTVIREGNVINLNGVTVAVAEACNGLRMLTSFLVISSMVAMLVKRDIKQKFIIVASSIPIALLCNTIRLTVTSIAFTYIDSARWEGAFHDFGGLAMMPVALGIIVFELWLLSNIFVAQEESIQQIIKRK